MADEKTRGLYRKFDVKRTDGSSEPGGRHERCSYFVLDLEHDEFAIPALKAYANACRAQYPALAQNIRDIINTPRQRCGCREASCPHSLAQAMVPNGPSEAAAAIMEENAENLGEKP